MGKANELGRTQQTNACGRSSSGPSATGDALALPTGGSLANASLPGETDWELARRQFLKTSGMGLGAAVLGAMLPQNSSASGISSSSDRPRAKRVIFLFMAGAPSQIDLFDYKPELDKQFRKPLPPSISMGQRVTAMTKGKEQLVATSKYKFARQGENGIRKCELLTHLSKDADYLCIVNSFNTNEINHEPAKTIICTGSYIPGRASMGA